MAVAQWRPLPSLSQVNDTLPTGHELLLQLTMQQLLCLLLLIPSIHGHGKPLHKLAALLLALWTAIVQNLSLLQKS